MSDGRVRRCHVEQMHTKRDTDVESGKMSQDTSPNPPEDSVEPVATDTSALEVEPEIPRAEPKTVSKAVPASSVLVRTYPKRQRKKVDRFDSSW